MSHSLHHRLKKALSTPEYLRIFILRTIGNFLMLSSLFMIAKTFYQPVKAEVRYLIDNYYHKRYVLVDDATPTDVEESQRPKGGLASILKVKDVEVLQPVDPNFGIIIPKIGANANVIANVDASQEKQYLDLLQKGVAHALGTALPGEGGHIFLFAHSTDYFWNVGTYNAIFYLLYKVEKGDEVDLFYKNQRYKYKIIETKIVDPTEVQYLTRKSNKEFLTLQTCWPPGTTLKRLLVFAVRVAE